MSKRKVILTIAPTGGMAHKSQNPHLPTQPAEIMVRVMREMDLEPATAAEAREMLRLPRRAGTQLAASH